MSNQWEALEGMVWVIGISLVLTVTGRGCADYNVAWEEGRRAVRVEAVKSGLSPNAIACILNSDNAACERAASESKP